MRWCIPRMAARWGIVIPGSFLSEIGTPRIQVYAPGDTQFPDLVHIRDRAGQIRAQRMVVTGIPDSPSKPSPSLKNKPGPVSKKIIENSIDKSHGSFEGVQQQQQHLTEQGQDKSLTSYEGNVYGDISVDKPMDKVGNQEVDSSSISDSDSFWRSVFPAYMRSKDEEEHLSASKDRQSHGSVKGMGLHGAAAARAAAAAAASAKELESHVNSLSNPSLMPSSSAPPCSSAQNPTGGKKLEDLISDDPIWAAIRAEARLEAEREPLLSSFLYASILAHPCFERSLGFVLANRLKNATLLATQLMDVLDDVFTKDANIRQAVRLDVQAVKDRDPSCRSYSSALLYLKVLVISYPLVNTCNFSV
ncbi:hypothetical protein L7F22_005217 [Adiantum nelumboides]|nr:hypothetical protein [Adiantum nelumboides]